MLNPIVHPGEVLADEPAERGVSATELARQIKVPPNRISQLVHGKRMITADTALRLGHWLGMNPQFWMNLQAQYDLLLAKQTLGEEIDDLPTVAA
jgi:antitoxin HigA-1